MRWSTRSTLLALLLACGTAIAQTPASPGPQATAPSKGHARDLSPLESRFHDRLTALTPDNALAYFQLGEEVAEAAQSRADTDLATTLFVLAATLDVDRGGHVASSACFALADVATSDRDRRWLVSTARLLSPQAVPPTWTRRPETPADDSASVQLATFLGLVRSGDGVQARQLLDKPGVERLLESYDRLLVRLGVSNGASGLEREAQRWPCPDCGNERVQKRGRAVNQPRLCVNCAGTPGPALTNSELIGHLRFESWLLDGAQRSWAAQVAADSGAPLIEASPDGISQLFGIDPARVYWRDGEWLETPDGSPAPKPANGPKPPAKPPAKPPEPKPNPAGVSGA
ncbi:MAG: hypothetical protein WC718_08395 [Phycisphaerales bacterium]|jgi:predicted RNA-binding Zn-ribbon protein involved in translation (DUF1610 family)